MKEWLTVLTPTGERPEAFEACVAMMKAQDHDGPVRWVIVDDGRVPQPTPVVDGWEILHIRPELLWRPGQNTQARNILVGLEYVVGRLVIVEDDDDYADWWLSKCYERLDSHDLVGESMSVYVHVNGKSKECLNRHHASLCSTAMKGPAVEAFREATETRDRFIDLVLWKRFDGSKALYRPKPRGVTGIKGWPGRPGIGTGHDL